MKENEIKKRWIEDSNYIEELSSEELFKVIFLYKDNIDIRPLIIKDADRIIIRCTTDYDMYNYFTLLTLRYSKINEAEINKLIEETIKSIFSNDSVIMLLKTYKHIKENGIKDKNEPFEYILELLKDKPTNISSVILFDYYIFPDFSLYLQSTHRTLATLIEAYQLYNPDLVSNKLFYGSSIIGKLLEGKNEEIISKYLREELKDKQISTRNIKMIGGGSTSLVYKIGDHVLKFGETRHNRRIYINHRILASILRKLELNENNEELFYVEIMKYIETGDITDEEVEEVRQDGFEQGLIWEDAKTYNCGILPDGYDNISEQEIDYSVIAGNIDYPYRREEFMKRKRKVVVLDNDDIHFNTLRSCG